MTFGMVLQRCIPGLYVNAVNKWIIILSLPMHKWDKQIQTSVFWALLTVNLRTTKSESWAKIDATSSKVGFQRKKHSTDGANEETTVNTSPTRKIRSGSKHGMLLAIMGPSLGFDMNKQGALNQPHFCHHNIAIGILHPAGSRNYLTIEGGDTLRNVWSDWWSN